MNELFRVNRVSAILDCSKKHIYRLIKEGKLAALQFGPRQTRVTRESIERYVRERLNEYRRENAIDILDKIKSQNGRLHG